MSGLVKVFSALVRAVIIAVAIYYIGPIVGAFIGMAIGNFVQGAINSLVSKSTPTEQSKVNVRLAEAIRWIHAGRPKTGGAVAFADFAADGDLWYIVIHSDSPLNSRYKVYLDEIEVTIDATSKEVLTKDFRLTSKNDPVDADGDGDWHIRVWTATYTMSDPTPPFPSSEFLSSFPAWTGDHKLVGTTFSVVHMKGMKIDDRFKMFKWRGPLGLGEPGITLVGEYAFCYDPRDETQTLGDATTYKFTRNSALIWAWFRTHRYGRRKSESTINWDRIAEQADICDQTVTGITGDTVRYRCDIAIPDDKDRGEAEQEILATMDGEIVFDEDGRYWCRSGYYYTPTVSLTRNRDIVAMESVEALDGESETQGVIIRYTDPDSKYTMQPSAAWANPNYYTAGEAASFLQIEIPSIQDHNQAMRIAKAIGMRRQPIYKLAPTTFLRGLKCARERFVDLQYDNTFAGDHEICTQVEVDPAGALCQFGLVPVDSNRWTLLSGEEKAKPNTTSSDTAVVPGAATGVSVSYNDGRIEATFTAPTQSVVKYQFQYIKTADIATDNWLEMTVQMSELIAYSPAVPAGVSFSVRNRSNSLFNRSAWSTPVTVTGDAVVYNGGDGATI